MNGRDDPYSSTAELGQHFTRLRPVRQNVLQWDEGKKDQASETNMTACSCCKTFGGLANLSKDDEERLLAYMDVMRHPSINYGAAYGFHGPICRPRFHIATQLMRFTDKELHVMLAMRRERFYRFQTK